MGTAVLDGWQLLFKGSKTGSYLTIEENLGYMVPVAIWEISPEDERALDRYTGVSKPKREYFIDDVIPDGI